MATAVDSDVAPRAAPGAIGGADGPSPGPDPDPREREARRVDPGTAVVVLVDVVAGLVAFGLAGASAAAALVFLGVVVTLDVIGHQSARRLAPSALDDAPRLAARGIILTAVMSAVGLRVNGDGVWGIAPMAAPVIVAAIYATAAVIGRGLAYGLIKRAKARGRARRHPHAGMGDGASPGDRLRTHVDHADVTGCLVDVRELAHPSTLRTRCPRPRRCLTTERARAAAPPP